MSVFVAKTFGLKNLGTILGIIFSVGSIVGMLEYSAVFVSNEYLHGDLTLVYAFSLIICIMLIPLVLYLRNHQNAKTKLRDVLIMKLEELQKSQ